MKWTSEELLFLRMNYPIIATKIVAERLNKSIDSVSKKTKKLKLRKLKLYQIDINHRRKYWCRWNKDKYTNNLNYKLTRCARRRLNSAIRNNHKSGSAVKDLGCSIEKFKLWIEMNWLEGMSWDNYGEWHIDHRRPLAKFNLKIEKSWLKRVILLIFNHCGPKIIILKEVEYNGQR